MATFLTTTETSAAIERVIREAKTELVLISAYVFPRIVYLDRLREAAARGVPITLMFGKRKLDDRVRAEFEKVPNLRIHFLDELHAKCYYNEKEAVVTSLNLLNSSEANNREMGVLLDRSVDGKAYDDCVREARSILVASQRLERRPPPAPKAVARESSGFVDVVLSNLSWLGAKRQEGACIRCGDGIDFDPQRPLCRDCYREWAKWENADYVEAHCHRCGKERETSFAKPLCGPCYRAFA